MTEFYTYSETKLFYTGAQYPPASEIERLAKYERGRVIFSGRHAEIYDRASSILADTPQAPQLKTLFIAVNIMDVLLTKPADLMVGDPPTYDSGRGPDSREQQRLDSIVEENDLTQMMHEIVIGGGYRGDSFIKTRFNLRDDFTEAEELGLTPPPAVMEPIIEPIDPSIVFPELSRGSKKRFKAINIAWVEWEVERSTGFLSYLTGVSTNEDPFLNVERHIPGYIIYERYKLITNGLNTFYDVPVPVYMIGEQVGESRIEPTGQTYMLVEHVPNKTTDDDWRGISSVEKLESVLSAINDRLVQIDYILWKHSDPTAYGPDVEDSTDGNVRFGSRYIPVDKEDATPGYMTWNSQLEGAFKELDILLGLVFQMSETPQWLFGTTLAADKGGTGTSHTDAGAIKARFMPILSKVKRIRSHVDRAFRNALWKALALENYGSKDVTGYEPVEAVYPTINWRDGIPSNPKEDAEVAQIRTGGKATWSVLDAIKAQGGVDNAMAEEIIRRIDADEARTLGTVESTVFNE
ncbi:portal protein [Paenibacillus sp. FSL L8-0436]|uniref:phage portal protein n=1 Tax=Paenibacillus sp. FSL L8-0436 TaxID=2954686 RepID=UPI0031589AA6